MEAVKAKFEKLDLIMLIDVVIGLADRLDDDADLALDIGLDVLGSRVSEPKFLEICSIIESRMC